MPPRFRSPIVAPLMVCAIATSGAGNGLAQPQPLEPVVRQIVQKIEGLENLEFVRFKNQAGQQVADLGFFGLEGRLTLGAPGPKGTSFEAQLDYSGLDVNFRGRRVAFVGKTRGVKEDGVGILSLARRNGRESILLGDGGARFKSNDGRTLVFVGIGSQANREVGVVQVNGKNIADLSEVFELATRDGVVPGTVMSIAENGGGISPATVAYDDKVVGVISGAGGLASGMQLGAREDDSNDLPIAMAGQVYVRVTLEGGTLRAGDLLVSSTRSGTAMRAVDRNRALGAVIGKALEPFEGSPAGEEGLIRMLVMNR
ncbi:MAG: hypothetical protein KIT09_34860 [Bryobacteraceae bacterium]|nr:hypothetical protein [Bryobacteraceae bacterium]